MNAQEIFEAAFSTAREPRSEAYKLGVLEILKYKLKETKQLQNPYKRGTAENDAFWSGTDEGLRRAKEFNESTLN